MLVSKIILYDGKLSVKKNESCSYCHMPQTGLTGPVSALNKTTVASPVPFGHASAHGILSLIPTSFSPVFHYNPEQGDFVGSILGHARQRTTPGQRSLRAGKSSSVGPRREGLDRPGMYGVSHVPATLSFHCGKALECASVCVPVAGECKGGMRSSRSAASCRPFSASSDNRRARDRVNYLRSNRRSNRGLRGLA